MTRPGRRGETLHNGDTMLTVRDSFTLAHPTDMSVGYTFTPHDNGVKVTHTTKQTCDSYDTTLEEARRFWRQLLRNGYTRF